MNCKKVEYFLFIKNKYINILNYLTEILSSYEEVFNYDNDDNDNDDDDDTESINIQYNKYKKEINDINFLIDDITNKIYKLCKHDFVQDEIDINPEKSQRIEYCKICEYTNDMI